MSDQDLTRQAELYRQINRNLGQINISLTDQLRIQNLLSMSAQQRAQQAAQAGSLTEQQLTAAGVAMVGLNNASAQTSQSVQGVQQNTELVSNGFSSLAGVGTGAMNSIHHAGETANNTLTTMHNLARGELSTAYATLQKKFGGMFGPGMIESPGNRLVESYRNVNFAVRQQLQAFDMYDVGGASLIDLLGGLNSTMEAYNHIADQAINMHALMRAEMQTEGQEAGRLAIEMGLLGKGMGLSSQQTSIFIQRQISLTGEANSDMLRDAAAVSKAMEAATGISSKMIGKSIAAITADTKNFGNVSVQEAGRISATLFELGLDYEDLGNMIGKFTAFDQAASAVSALTTVFGVQIDAMDMMQLANEDQEQFLHRMREGFLAAGRSADTLTLAEKRLIQEQLGLKDVESVERLLDPTAAISSLQDLTQATQAAPDEMSEVLQSLSGDIQDFGRLTDFTMDRTAQFIRDGATAPLEETAIAAEQAAVKIGRAFRGALGRGEDTALRDFADSMRGIADLGDTDLSSINRDIAAIADSVTQIGSGLNAENFRTSMQEIGEILSSLDLGSRITEGIHGAVTSIEEAFASMAANIVTTLQEAELIRDNTPHTSLETAAIQNVRATREMSEDMVDSIATAGVNINRIQQENVEQQARRYAMTTGAITDSFTGVFENMTEQGAEAFNRISAISDTSLESQLADASSVYSRMARELGYLGVTYEQMSDQQKEQLRESLRLGENYEQQIRTIMQSEEAQRGRREESQGDFITNMLHTYRSLGEAEQSRLMGNEDFMTSLRENYNITADQFSSMMSGDGRDIESTVRANLRAKQERRAAEAATQAAEEESSSGASQDVSRQSRAQTQHLSRLYEATVENRAELRRQTTALNQLTERLGEQPTPVNLYMDGTLVADAVINNPAGSQDSEGSVLIQRS